MRLLRLMSIFIFTLGIFTTANAASELTCPSVSDVKQLNNIWPHGSWMPLYVENSELASDEDVSKFRKAVTQFGRAEWSGDFLEAGHCFYAGEDPIMQRITIARAMLKPKPDDQHWYLITTKTLGCFGFSPEVCIFGGVG